LPRGECVADGCTETVYIVKLGVCKLHYSRLRTGHDLGPAESKRIIGDDERRFWSNVDVRDPDECWPWTGAATNGRGYFGVQGKTVRATRYLLGVIDGIDIEGLFVCHRCDNPNCVNRQHLFPGTPLENARDMIEKGRAAKPGARVTPAFVRNVRELHDAGYEIKELARISGVNYWTMHAMISGRTWKDVV
jgi:hypothetical protein